MFAVVGLGWYGWAVARNDGLLGYFLGAVLMDRVLSDRFERSPEFYQPFVRYLPALALGGFVWAAFVPGLIQRTRLYRWRTTWETLRSVSRRRAAARSST